jgi:hypothetical protein
LESCETTIIDRAIKHRQLTENRSFGFESNGDGKEERYGGNPTSHTPAHNVPAVAAAFRL